MNNAKNIKLWKQEIQRLIQTFKDILKLNFFPIGFILIVNLIYFSEFEFIFKLNKKGITAMFLSLSIQILIFFILQRIVFKFKYNSIIIGIYLCFLTLCFLISGTGKFYWREIPTLYLIYDTVVQDFSLLNNAPIPWQIIVSTLFIFFSLTIKINSILQINKKNVVPGKLILTIAVFGLINYGMLAYKNKTHNRWAYRDIVGEDPVMGIFKSSRHNLNNYAKAFTFDTNYSKLVLKADAPNIIIIICDALRDDHLSINGYVRNTTPFLDSLITHDSTTYLSSFHTSSCTSTFCGITSTLYGINFELLSKSNIGIHDILHSKGYKSSFILCGSHRSYYNLTDFYGKRIDNYFESKDIKNIDKSIPASSDETLIAYLNSTQFKYNSKERQFIYFHVMAPHEISYKKEFFPVSKKKTYQDQINDYDNGVIQADNILKEIYYNLNSKNLLKNSMIIITSDHGQALNQTNGFKHFGHGFWPIGETINIPLIIIDKQNNYRRDYSTKIDLYPTIVDRCFHNSKIVTKNTHGFSLLKPAPIVRKTFHLGELRNEGEPSIAIIESRNGKPIYKYLYNPSNNESFLYDLKNSKSEDAKIYNDSLQNYFKKEHAKYLNTIN
jgi:glucan phosphoethanolaminetransferase (alkaline phosphatase superfamily)